MGLNPKYLRNFYRITKQIHLERYECRTTNHKIKSIFLASLSMKEKESTCKNFKSFSNHVNKVFSNVGEFSSLSNKLYTKKSKQLVKLSGNSSNSFKRSFHGMISYWNSLKKPILIKKPSNIVSLNLSTSLCVKFFKLIHNNLKKSKV